MSRWSSLGSSLAIVAAAAGVSAVAGCGGVRDAGLSAPKARVLQAFPVWCTAWQLRCPTEPAPNVPNPDTPWTKDEWRHALAAIRAVSLAPMDVRVTLAELEDEGLRKVFALLGAEDYLTRTRDRARDSGLVEVRAGDGRLTVEATRAASFNGAGGLVVRNDARTSLRVDERLEIAVEGVSLANTGSASDRLDALVVSATNLMEWRGRSGLKVVDVPIAFLMEEVTGFDLDGSRGRDDDGFSFAALLAAAEPLAKWLTSGRRELELGRDVFTALGQHVPPLVRDETNARTARYLLERLSSVATSEALRRDRLIAATATESIRCRLGGEAELTLGTSFGIDSVTPISEGKVRVRLRGAQARPLRGLVRPQISLAVVDVEDKRLTVHDVPVLGTYTIDLDRSNGRDLKLRCPG